LSQKHQPVRKQSVRQFLLKNNQFVFVILLSLLFIVGCEKKQYTILDSTGNAITIKSTSFTPAVINTDTINISGHSVHSPDDLLTIEGTATLCMDLLTVDQLNFVGFSVLGALNDEIINSRVQFDNGDRPSKITNDSIYSGKVSFQIDRSNIGKFYLVIWSENISGYQSTYQYIPFSVVRFNHPPILSNLQMDTLVSVAGITNVLKLRIIATDQDGQFDITKVYFNSFKPNGLPSSGNPFLMHTAGSQADSNYILNISLPANTERGVYRFEFHAIDRFNDASNTIIQNITVTH
jgi:hypothetical protein